MTGRHVEKNNSSRMIQPMKKWFSSDFFYCDTKHRRLIIHGAITWAFS